MQSVGRFNQSDINTVEWERGGASYGGGSNQTITKLFSFEEFGGQEFHGGVGGGQLPIVKVLTKLGYW